MTEVVIAGVGQTPVAEHWDLSIRELALQAIQAAQADAGYLRPDVLFVGNMLGPALSRQAHLGSLIADFSGYSGLEAVVVEAAGASGGAAMRLGYMAIASGEAEVALVVGVEKTTDQPGQMVEEAFSSTLDSDYEAVPGLTLAAQAALLMRLYLYEFGAQAGALAGFPITAHANGATNPNAMYRSPISLESYSKAGMISDPLNLFDVAPYGDGAAAVILVRQELLPSSHPHPRVRLVGSGMATGTLALHDRPDPLDFNAARLSIERAWRQSGSSPLKVDLFELYDSYSIYAALVLEAAGFAGRGQGWRLAQEQAIGLRGTLPISTMGGLKARGNPGGATGVYQAVEATLQLRGQAGQNQVHGARRALIQCLGGPASTAVAHVLEVVP